MNVVFFNFLIPDDVDILGNDLIFVRLVNVPDFLEVLKTFLELFLNKLVEFLGVNF